MGYTQVTLQPMQPKASKLTTFAPKGENLLSLSQFLDNSFAIKIQNLLPIADAKFEKVGGFTDFITNGTTALTVGLKDSTFTYYSQAKVLFVNDGTSDITVKTFTNGNITSIVKFGAYIFVATGQDKIERVTKTLAYDGQTVNLTIGQTITQTPSGATGVIIEDTDTGVAGVLTLDDVTGTFVNNQGFTDPLGGDGTADGTLNHVSTTITGSPNAKILFVFGTRLYAGNIEGNPSQVQSPQEFTGTNPPFDTWTGAVSPPLTTDNFDFTFAAAGAVTDISTLGAQVVTFYEHGEAGTRTEVINVDGSGLRLNFLTDFQRQGEGGLKALATKFGIFYVNKRGVFQMVSGGATNQPFSEQQVKISALFSPEFTESLDFTNAALYHDEERNLLFISVGEDATFNNTVLVYNTETKAFTRISGLYVNDFFTDNVNIFATSSIEGKVLKLFDGNSFGGQDIQVTFIQELTEGEVINLNRLREVYAQGKLHPDTVITISFDIYDKNGILSTDFKSLTWTLQSSSTANTGIGTGSIGGQPIGGGGVGVDIFEDWLHKRLQIYEYSRIVLIVTEESSLPLELNWISLIKESIGRNLNYTN